ncbi:hypothetical protein [Hymenobacter convexus]|uniref:hypothetical protein n=1 Tax=Hymenobacter sp. CA1UV-4 TaxID=3063782 RepID=UPI00271334BB|nr:hypothetical protein [Hymenobacter sp. CA1UV-4]MDO7854428.1 hypothetical protein [Hymenobacter sp. CA1UV-4]
METPMDYANGKIEALADLRDLLKPECERVFTDLLAEDNSEDERRSLLARLDELTLFRAELNAHSLALFSAEVACQHGLNGTVPANWEQTGGGEPYDAHHAVISVLEWAPGRGQGLSPTLMTFFDELPRARSADFADGMSAAMAAFPIPSLAPENDYGAGPREVTHKEIDGHADAILLRLIEKTRFLQDYNQDFTDALMLAKTGGNFDKIYKLVCQTA